MQRLPYNNIVFILYQWYADTKKTLEIIDRALRDCCDLEDLPFDGKLMILGRDFRKNVPVAKHDCKINIIQECTKYFHVWAKFEIMKLKNNIRCSDWNFLLKIREGDIPFKSLKNGKEKTFLTKFLVP